MSTLTQLLLARATDYDSATLAIKGELTHVFEGVSLCTGKPLDMFDWRDVTVVEDFLVISAKVQIDDLEMAIDPQTGEPIYSDDSDANQTRPLTVIVPYTLAVEGTSDEVCEFLNANTTEPQLPGEAVDPPAPPSFDDQHVTYLYNRETVH